MFAASVLDLALAVCINLQRFWAAGVSLVFSGFRFDGFINTFPILSKSEADAEALRHSRLTAESGRLVANWVTAWGSMFVSSKAASFSARSARSNSILPIMNVILSRLVIFISNTTLVKKRMLFKVTEYWIIN